VLQLNGKFRLFPWRSNLVLSPVSLKNRQEGIHKKENNQLEGSVADPHQCDANAGLAFHFDRIWSGSSFPL
jgi:hypothetical protein